MWKGRGKRFYGYRRGSAVVSLERSELDPPHARILADPDIYPAFLQHDSPYTEQKLLTLKCISESHELAFPLLPFHLLLNVRLRNKKNNKI